MTQHPPNMRDPNVASYRERMLHRPPARERSEKPRSELTLLSWPRFLWTPHCPLEPRRNGPHEGQFS
jgi:hypothetical protein